MADIALTLYPPVNGTALEAGDINAWNYNPTAPGTSFAELNGLLDADNLSTQTDYVDWPMIRQKAMTESRHAAGTANLDYFDYWFTDVPSDTSVPGDDDAYEKNFITIPGASCTVHVPWENAKILACMGLTWSNDSDDLTHNSVIRLFLDDVMLDTTHRRQVDKTMWSGGTQYMGFFKGRFWHGFYMSAAVVTPGDHTLSLRLLASSDCHQTRIRCRSMKALAFRVQ